MLGDLTCRGDWFGGGVFSGEDFAEFSHNLTSWWQKNDQLESLARRL